MRECKIVSSKFHIANVHTLEVARAHGAYSSLSQMKNYTAQQIIQVIKDSMLRGKGGGGAPAGLKWELLAHNAKKPNFLAVNCDESEPGTFKDRQIISKDPHLLIEGIILTCYAIAAKSAYIYIRGEYKEYQDILQGAIDEAYAAGLLEECDITIHRGAGAYICGEKSALLESMEGKRGHPRLKPKQKEPEWFFDNPTLVNNVETIASVPFIVQNGADAYRAFGTEKSPGTLLFAMSGHINTPGVYEAEFGTNMLEYIEQYGNGVKDGKKLKAIIPGGVSCGVLTAEECKGLTLDYEALRAVGSSLGTGGMIVMDEDTSMPEVLKNILEFYHEESCGQCTPCREGSAWSDKIVGRILDGKGTKADLEKLFELADTMNGKTICVFAPSISQVLVSFITKFPSEFEELVS